jgi:hypothetical protein
MKIPATTLFLTLLGVPVLADGFECDLKFECQGNLGCDEVSYQPYIDTDWGQVVVKNYGPEILMDRIPADTDSGTWKLFANLPNDGLFVVVINEDTSAVFTSYLRQSSGIRVVSVYGNCEPRG